MLYIIRGLPGSGKSTLAREFIEFGLADSHFETDMWFMQGDEYVFVPELLSQYHAECFDSVCKELQIGYTVVVSNTFCRNWEMQKYINYCKKQDITYTVITCEGHYPNSHGVPPYIYSSMKDRWERYEQD